MITATFIIFVLTEGDDAPDILGVYNIQTGEFKDIPETEGLESYIVYKGILYSICKEDKIISYNIETGYQKTIDCKGMGYGCEIGAYKDNLVILSAVNKTTSLYEYNLSSQRLIKLCECPSNIDCICTTRIGIYLYDWFGDNINWLKEDNGKYSVVPITGN